MSQHKIELLFKKRLDIDVLKLGDCWWKKYYKETLSQGVWDLLSINKWIEVCLWVCKEFREKTQIQENLELQSISQ